MKKTQKDLPNVILALMIWAIPAALFLVFWAATTLPGWALLGGAFAVSVFWAFVTDVMNGRIGGKR